MKPPKSLVNFWYRELKRHGFVDVEARVKWRHTTLEDCVVQYDALPDVADEREAQ